MDIYFLHNIDLISVSVVIAATAVLGFSVYFNNPKSISHQVFLAFALVTASWGTVTYLSYQSTSSQTVLWLFRATMFLAVLQAFLLYLFFKVFPESSFIFSKRIKYGVLPLTALTAIITLTKFLFSGIISRVEAGKVAVVSKGPGLLFFGVVAVGLVLAGIYELIKKVRRTTDSSQKRTYIIIAMGATITFLLIIVFSFIAATFFANPRYVPLGSIFFFPFIAFTSYAILRYKLFNVRAVWAAVLVFMLAVTTFLEVIFTREPLLFIYRGSIFLLILVFGILLIRGIIHEVRQREEIQNLAERLKSVNNILAHDVKTAFAKGRDAVSLILEGSYGSFPEKARPILERLSNDWGKMLGAITNILAAGRETTLAVEPFDLRDALREVVKDLATDAEIKHLKISVDIADDDYNILADKTQLSTHVLKNLIENAINYNLENGSVVIKLSKKDPKTFLLSVADTGIGIKEEDRPNIFKEGGRGKESVKFNVHSSGYGLAIAKKTTEAHGGKIWFESEGVPGKGTIFFVELPREAKSGFMVHRPASA